MKPGYQHRVVVFRCVGEGGGWTLERIGEADLLLEGRLMANCLGQVFAGANGLEPYVPYDEVELFLSLRSPVGRPHLSVRLAGDGSGWVEFALGRANSPPKPKYLRLLGEYQRSVGQQPFSVEEVASGDDDADASVAA